MWKFNRLGDETTTKCQCHVSFSDLFCQLWRQQLTRELYVALLYNQTWRNVLCARKMC